MMTKTETKNYEVTLTRSEWYTITVEANNKSEAEEKAWNTLTELGTEMFEVTGGEWEQDSHIEEVDED